MQRQIPWDARRGMNCGQYSGQPVDACSAHRMTHLPCVVEAVLAQRSSVVSHDCQQPDSTTLVASKDSAVQKD